MPHTREEYGVYAWDPTNRYYAECLKWHLSFEKSPEEVHKLGLEEVERIRTKMLKVCIDFINILLNIHFINILIKLRLTKVYM